MCVFQTFRENVLVLNINCSDDKLRKHSSWNTLSVLGLWWKGQLTHGRTDSKSIQTVRQEFPASKQVATALYKAAHRPTVLVLLKTKFVF